MVRGKTPGTKTDPVQKAAAMVARKLHSPRIIARDCGLDYGHMLKLMLDPDFIALVETYKRIQKEQVPELFVADRDNRLYALNNLMSRYIQLVEERESRHGEYSDTGLVAMTETVKRANGKEEVLDRKYEFDASLDKAIKETLKHAAIELGEWQEKRELSGPGGTELSISAVIMELADDEEPSQEDTEPGREEVGDYQSESDDNGLPYRGDHW